MALKKPHELLEGMVLAADVKNLDGQILFKKGLELAERQIEILQMWGIPNVEIEGGEEPADRLNLDQFSPQTLEKAERMADRRFKLVTSSHPAVEMVRKICIGREARAIAREEASK